MKKFFVLIFQILFATLVLFFVLEGICTALGFAPGSSSFVEGVVLQEKLSTWKPKNEFRIFTYGESTMHGSSYWPVSNPARWLDAYLKDFLPGYRIRVINFARMGYGSDFIYDTFHDTLAYKPDLVIFYLGHNTFLPDNRVDQVLAERRKPRYQLRRLIEKSRFISAVYRQVVRTRKRLKLKSPPQDSIEYRVIETYPGQRTWENAAPRNGKYYWENIAFFKENVIAIINLAERKKIPMIFFRPAANLKDFPPNLSTHLKKISPEELAQWNSFYQEGKKAQGEGNPIQALESYEKAYAIDPTFAELSFRMGRIYFKNGDLARAKQLFEEARDNDIEICRATKEILQFFDGLKNRRNIPLLDAEKIVVSEAPGGILGEPIVEDNVHFSIKGHALLGRALADEIARRHWIAPREKWQFQRKRSYEEIARALGVDQELLFSADLKFVNYFASRMENRLYFANRALQIHPNHPRALRYLAWTYWLIGEKNKAVEIYRKLEQSSAASLKEVFQAQPDVKKAFHSNL